VNTDHITRDKEASTGTALIIVQKTGENSIIVVGGANRRLSVRDVDAVEELIERSSLVVMQFETPMRTVARACELAKKHGTPVLIDAGPPTKCPDSVLKGLAIISPNEREAEYLTGLAIDDVASAAEAARALLEKGARAVVLKLGEKGSLCATRKEIAYLEGNRIKVVDTTAAGDAFTAALAVGFVGGKSLVEATRYANYAGAFACTRFGAQPSMPEREELDSLISRIEAKRARR
jgi:ribokinase